MFKTKYRIRGTVYRMNLYDVQERYWWWPFWQLTNYSHGWCVTIEEAQKYKKWLEEKDHGL